MESYLNRVEGNICMTLVQYGPDITVLIFNAIGEKIWVDKIETSGKFVANLSRFRRGFYFVSAKSGGVEEMIRISLSNTVKRICFLIEEPLNLIIKV